MDLILYRYDIVKIEPEVAGQKRARVIHLLETHEGCQYRKDMVTYFKATLITSRKLGKDSDQIRVVYSGEGEDVTGPSSRDKRSERPLG
ncbi:uncharacterized protein BCR38DRAFT_482790 [Pseudomassariella vexata]|uniref:Uncharacterized protein n=1 Tax=Pseudomassariella vexata TaxID=1141098 RepID=A0A1Y2E748_9PEZI|nr:uncharacterized protein BCR38DRAFT_482790 [Pseudomassariella vexata]ORY67154.1 hypothetical protein BCR38DRAFT_482790 [Pseudomassariella vexata]